jgi:hypothetical protein
MKKIILTLGIALGSYFVSNAQDAPQPTANPNAPEITFDTEVIDYGTIEHNADGNREFKFKNTGKEPLIITNCQGSCGCTVPTWPHEPIKPGGTSSIKVKYATDRVGQFSKNVTVNSNATNGTNGTITLTIKGNVLPGDAEPK